MKEQSINLFFSIYLHIFLLFCFLTFFFWNIMSKEEKRGINKNIVSEIPNTLNNINISNEIFTDQITEFYNKYFEGENKTVQRNNNHLFELNITIIIIFFIGFLLCMFVHYYFCNKTIDLNEIILENIILLISLAFIEIYFFTNITSKYTPILPSYLPNSIKKRIIKLA